MINFTVSSIYNFTELKTEVMINKQVKLVTVTRKDLSQGAQLVQSAHSLAEFAHQHPSQFNEWMEKSKYLVSLSVRDEDSLHDLYYRLRSIGAYVVTFCEPDMDNQLTSICYFVTPEHLKITKKLDLALKN